MDRMGAMGFAAAASTHAPLPKTVSAHTKSEGPRLWPVQRLDYLFWLLVQWPTN